MIKYCYYLNLDRRTDRKNNIESELNRSEILKNIYQRFSAVDGSTIHPRNLEKNLLTQNAIEDILSDTVTAWGLSLTQGALGVLLSYKKLFEEISELDDTVITFEDDVVIDDNFDDELKKILSELPEDFDICYLGYGDIDIEKIKFSESLSIPKGMVVCLPALIISPKGAKKIINSLVNIDHQIDTAIYRQHDNLKTFVSNKKIVKIKNHLGSDIQGNNNCIKKYEKQNYIISTLAHGDVANDNARKFAKDLKFFNQQLLIVTNKKGFFKDLDNVIEIEYPGELFSYNKKIICFEEGFKLKDAVVYIDCDTRIFYNNFKNTNTNFFINIEPGFHSSWNWGKIVRDDNRFFTSKDLQGRVAGYGERALELCKKINIDYSEASHYQEGVLIVSKQYGKEQVFLNIWRELSTELDKYEESLGVTKLGVGEGNLIGLALTYSGLEIKGPEVCNILGESLKYNFWGIYRDEYLKNFPNRKLVKTSDGIEIGNGIVNVEFKDKIVELSYILTKVEDNMICLSFNWNRNNAVELLDHEFKIDEQIYHFNSDKSNEFHFNNKETFTIEHTYDWYGEKNWIEIFRYE